MIPVASQDLLEDIHGVGRSLTDDDVLLDGDEQSELPFALTHRVTWPERMSNDSERIYVENWVRRQKIQLTLDHILGGPDGKAMRPTDRDSIVAASVIQWLGTNCGRGFIDECEREIDNGNRISRHWAWTDATPTELEDAKLVAAPVKDHPMYRALVFRIARSIRGRFWKLESELGATKKDAERKIAAANLRAATGEERGRKLAMATLFSPVTSTTTRIQRGLAIGKR